MRRTADGEEYETLPDEPSFVSAADAVSRHHNCGVREDLAWEAKGRRVRDGWWLLSRLLPPSGERLWPAVENKWAPPLEGEEEGEKEEEPVVECGGGNPVARL